MNEKDSTRSNVSVTLERNRKEAAMPSEQISAIGKIAASSVGVIVGAYTVFYSLVIQHPLSDSSYIDHETYGGDAYTGIQNAAASTGNFVLNLHKDLDEILLTALIIAGLFMIAYFAVKIFEGVGELASIKAACTPVNAALTATTCPFCHKPVDPNASFCTKCGASLGKKTPSSASANTDSASSSESLDNAKKLKDRSTDEKTVETEDGRA